MKPLRHYEPPDPLGETCTWCNQPAETPGLNDANEECPCRCHPGWELRPPWNGNIPEGWGAFQDEAEPHLRSRLAAVEAERDVLADENRRLREALQRIARSGHAGETMRHIAREALS